MKKSSATSSFTSIYRAALALCILVMGTACSNDEPALTEAFLKIYDDSDLDVSYRPIDVVETVDGYIILTGTELSKSDFMGISLMKIDEKGEYVFEVALSDYVVPIGDLYLNSADSNSYFFAMNPTSFQAVLIGVNPALEIEVDVPIGGIDYPLSAAPLSNGNLLLQSYDPLSQETEISEISLDGSFVSGNSYSIGPGDDVLDEITNHYLNTSERPLPFFCGEVTAGSYYFNGFYNYIFSLVFTDFSNAPSGVIQGLRPSKAGIRSVLSQGSGNFAVSGFQFDENYQLASITLPTSGNSSSADLYTGDMAELKPYTPVNIINHSAGSTFTVFASETKGNQILLNFYDQNGAIAGMHRIGFLNPYSFSSIKTGSDNSLLVLGTTFVAGRFERIALNKIPESEVLSFVN
ncbi:MAG: hypothetical protein HRT61_11160 [Ekhidna sp.]|nr:hypothetical protein [Ekhidna sp.]